MKKYWLLKSEPTAYSIDDLKKDKYTSWTGIRNFQARNFIRDEIKVGDECLFYHSSCKDVGIVGLAVVSKTAYADPTQFDKKSEYFEPKSNQEKFSWYCIEIKFVKKFEDILTLAEIKADKKLDDILLIQKGSRLSVQPVSNKNFEYILQKIENS